MDIALIVIQIIALIIIGVLLCQIWKFLNRKDIPDDEVLGEERAKYLTDRLNILRVCFIVEAAASILQLILRIIGEIQK